MSSLLSDESPFTSVDGFACCVLPVLAVVLGVVGLRTLMRSTEGELDTRPRRNRLGALLLKLALALGVWALVDLGLQYAPYWKMHQRYPRVLARTSRPLVEAIDRYVGEHRRAPESLDALLPGYLDALPETGFPGARSFTYRRVPVSSTEYELVVPCRAPFPFDSTSEFRFDTPTRTWSWVEGGP
ncbi:MAG: hypothetical protein IPJ77_04225 [Planctomycetes bacterium]|nr:hypothetical protein [Planctomycetota bacterium]